jgi:tetratricopeptide (TPR) repeat protein
MKKRTTFTGIVGFMRSIGLILISVAGLSGLVEPNELPEQYSTEVSPARNLGKGSNSPQRNIKEWREAIGLHNPGKVDNAAISLAFFRARDVEDILDFVTKLASKPAKSARRELAEAPILRRLLDLTDKEVQQGDLTRILKLGALLHTDIALLELWTAAQNPRESLAVLEDGRAIIRPQTLHWTYAHRLIDAISKIPSQNQIVRQWYIATTAHMQNRGLLAYADANLKCALELFPVDSKLLFYAGIQHERLASSSIQNSEFIPTRKVFMGSPQQELKQGRQFLEKAIAVNPGFSEAHLHLGRVAGLLGDHPKALVELQKAASDISDSLLLYYASLYLGCEYEASFRPSEARVQYERAAMLYPTAQSPLLALSHLAHGSGDPEGALAALQRVFDLRPVNRSNDDPWWNYESSHVREAGALILELYQALGESRQ